MLAFHLTHSMTLRGVHPVDPVNPVEASETKPTTQMGPPCKAHNERDCVKYWESLPPSSRHDPLDPLDPPLNPPLTMLLHAPAKHLHDATLSVSAGRA